MPDYHWDHIHLRTSNAEAMANWFEEMLGAEIVRTTQQGKTRIDIKLSGQNIFLAPVDPADKVHRAPTIPYLGLEHFGLSVSGLDDVVTELKRKGVEFTTEHNNPRPGIRMCFIRGPEGISIELLERNPRYA